MKVCVVGSGAREHALAHALSRTAEVVVTPGNPLIPASTDQPPEEIEADLFVVGPEAPLVDGMADRLRARGALVFGPGADGARLEGSKAWMKELVAAADVPTARHGTFTDRAAAEAYLDTMGDLFVIKTDGLAAGKGVLVTTSRQEASDAVAEYLSGSAFGDAGRTVVIEEGMVGPELSLLAVCDGQGAVALAPAQDFKRVGDDDTGPNTGGMGAYSPVPDVDDALVDQVMDRFVLPTLATLRARDIDYRGVLYAGLMLTPEGPKLVEYNVRFGDPEAEVVLPRYDGDLAQLLAEAASGRIESSPSFTADAAVTVVAAAEGYPRSPRTGDVISGLDEASSVPGVVVFGAGVARDERGRTVTAGGRVLAVTALAPRLAEARIRAYDAIDRISWPGRFSRGDIAAAAAAGDPAEVTGAG
ncbi:phosphoribosylamine--glycine ligase [Actinomarinicola tropica]|uniref:Phosphoribosylamine--glycine ligase n=1 Tax=Actinomarinicola tropica TaxID=2789776 RepID=A0A5Q2RQR1_9ACTN|nr:phosphoribosylamine--glycine ligase [Actinomarinicola tropica]QGG96766.1 phosphoribosylamine--glycine ligase [Actinomarinicola tropica]